MRIPLASVVVGAVMGFCVLVGVWLWHDREILETAMRGVIGVVTTPFVFEATVGFLGFMLVMAWNAWRRKREGDGWVVLDEDEE